MAIKELETEIKKVQERIATGKIHLDKGLILIENLEGEIQAMHQARELINKAGYQKKEGLRASKRGN
jgi:hypothetical protein